jgi:hypothetical protein
MLPELLDFGTKAAPHHYYHYIQSKSISTMKFFSIFNSKTHPEEPTAFSNAKKVIQVLDKVGDWDEIKDIVEEGAPFVCEADARSDVKTIRGWYDWMVNFKANICSVLCSCCSVSRDSYRIWRSMRSDEQAR